MKKCTLGAILFGAGVMVGWMLHPPCPHCPDKKEVDAQPKQQPEKRQSPYIDLAANLKAMEQQADDKAEKQRAAWKNATVTSDPVAQAIGRLGA